tara:strand:+ start:7684 stop:7857 length:174 start_codon:yes stop_codon:yes gene_type:complete
MKRVLHTVIGFPKRFAGKFRDAVADKKQRSKQKYHKPSFVANVISATINTFRRDGKK